MGPPPFRAKFDERSRNFGSGSDYIAAYFSKLGFGESGTFAVGVVDAERVSSGYQFTEMLGTKLPFPDGRFDFIISNMSLSILRVESSTRIWLRSVAACATMASSILPFRTAGVSSMPTIDSPS